VTPEQTSARYYICRTYARELRRLAECEQEHAAIARLAGFVGEAADVQTAAEIYRRAGEGANAADLLRQLDPACAHRSSVTPADGLGSFCRDCGETLA
jgi:hypothetical protein